MKIYVLRVASTFPDGHPRAGEPTGFIEKIIAGQKVQTLRTIGENTRFWDNIAKEVNQGRALLSLRYWAGRPFYSKQIEFKVLDKMAVETISLELNPFDGGFAIPGHDVAALAKADGLSPEDLEKWFFPKNQYYENKKISVKQIKF